MVIIENVDHIDDRFSVIVNVNCGRLYVAFWLCFCLCFSRIFGTAICISACMNFLIPGACKVHYGMVIFVRILQGLVEVSRTLNWKCVINPNPKLNLYLIMLNF